jgi:hypothetical protein
MRNVYITPYEMQNNPATNRRAPFPNALFRTPMPMFNPRQLQFSAKLTF